ncbi:MAG TPA: succinate dehydrogenase, hydrophobic membrane anchor protein [Solimonas sp.]|nr:succinate dehydrogenase, hydrophobic membrane anchor protein [Solimonas sp.]
MSLRSPLGRARGLGSAKSGVHHFWVQRLSALALIPLALWFVFTLARLPQYGFYYMRHWVSTPSVAVTLVLFLAAAIYHSALGLQVVIEDYTGSEAKKIVSMVLMQFAHAVIAAASIFAVLKVALA